MSKSCCCSFLQTSYPILRGKIMLVTMKSWYWLCMFTMRDFKNISLVLYRFVSWLGIMAVFGCGFLWSCFQLHVLLFLCDAFILDFLKVCVTVRSSELRQHIHIDTRRCPKEKCKHPCKPTPQLAAPWNVSQARDLQRLHCWFQERV